MHDSARDASEECACVTNRSLISVAAVCRGKIDYRHCFSCRLLLLNDYHVVVVVVNVVVVVVIVVVVVVAAAAAATIKQVKSIYFSNPLEKKRKGRPN